MGDRALALGLAGMLLAAAMAAGRAAERTPTMALAVDGSVPLSFSDDRFSKPSGRADYLTSPYLRLALDGKLVPDLSYSLYASGGFDKYPSRVDADSTFATLGASLSKRWGEFRVASYLYTDAAKLWRVNPRMSVSRRFSDDPRRRVMSSR